MEISAPNKVKEIPRDGYMRPLVTPPDGGKATGYTRCTTFVGLTEDMFTLNQWQTRMVGLGLAARPDLVALIGAYEGNTKELNKIMEQAAEAAGSKRSANIGTAIHTYTEIADVLGRVPDAMPEIYKADIEAYLIATEAIQHEHMETFMVMDELQVGGTPDRISRLPDGRLVIMDVKTGGLPNAPLLGVAKMAQQLAMYSRSVLYDFETNTRTRLDIDLKTGVIIHLPAGKGVCNLVEVDLEAGWEGVLLCKAIRDYRKTHKNPSKAFELDEVEEEVFDNRPDTVQEWLGLK